MIRNRWCAGNSLVELLLAVTLGLGILLAAVQLMRTQVRTIVAVRADLEAFSELRWALQTALRDVKRSGADPRGLGLSPIVEAGSDVLRLEGDFDADGRIDPTSEETVRLSWSRRDGGRVLRRVGRQSMSLAAGVPPTGLRFRYFDERGRSVALTPGATERDGIVRVGLELEVVPSPGSVSRGVRVATAVALRTFPDRIRDPGGGE